MLEELGRQAEFYARSAVAAPRTLRRYRSEVLRLLADVSLGSGVLAAIGGTVMVIAVLVGAAGVELGIQGHGLLSSVGVDALAGFVSSYANTREVAPLLAGIGLTATVGAGFTAQLGAMRVSQEIDALEAMAVPPIPFLVTTRMIAGFVAVIPLYAVAVLMSFTATRVVLTGVYGQPAGTYQHYFTAFLQPADLLWSFGKALVMAVLVILVCCYQGFAATGGPAGVGMAVGKAVRTCLVGVLLTDMLLDFVIYSGPSTVHISG
ncbi:ABC transporter permease [Pseudonocardiaceae bacterium YIM PH 21723]|nr:ABC transporter permease [Pseudonocardiaceae bacterium YIM PH 21723]